MNKKKNYTDEFKIKVIMEVLKDERTLNEIASEYQVHACTIRDWKKQFMENISLAINPQKGLDKYKQALEAERKEKEELYKQIGKLTTQLDWAKKNLNNLDLSIKKDLVNEKDELPIKTKCEIIGLSRSICYYESVENTDDKSAILNFIEDIFSKRPYYGHRRIHQYLIEAG